MSSVFVSGSLGFDIIFSIPHDFRDSIPVEDGAIRSFNASYVANNKKEWFGGTGGNIGYWLGTQNISSSLYSAVGKDFETLGYATHLQNAQVDLRGPVGEFTAHAYMISDPIHQQLIIWQPNSYTLHEEHNLSDYFSKEELSQFTHAIFSAGTPTSITKHMEEFRMINPHAFIIFDPGHVTAIFTADLFNRCMEMSDLLIGNDIEFRLFEKLGLPDSFDAVETLGDRGAKLLYKGEEFSYDAVAVDKVSETTGAGDAFRAGLLAELSKGTELKDALDKGLELGAHCVQLPSGQQQ